MQFKFRVYDRDIESVVYLEDMISRALNHKDRMLNGEVIVDCDTGNILMLMRMPSNVITWMQYTGLNDKNDKEIYEGDIVKWGDHLCQAKGNCETVQVVWSGGAFCIKDKKGTLHEFFHYFSHKWNDMPYASEDEPMDIVQYFRNAFEVIGNIYENSELLN